MTSFENNNDRALKINVIPEDSEIALKETKNIRSKIEKLGIVGGLKEFVMKLRNGIGSLLKSSPDELPVEQDEEKEEIVKEIIAEVEEEVSAEQLIQFIEERDLNAQEYDDLLKKYLPKLDYKGQSEVYQALWKDMQTIEIFSNIYLFDKFTLSDKRIFIERIETDGDFTDAFLRSINVHRKNKDQFQKYFEGFDISFLDR